MRTSAQPPTLSDFHPPLPAGGETDRDRHRPRRVTIAAALLAAQAIVGLAGLAVLFAYRDNLAPAKEGPSFYETNSAVETASIATVVIYLAIVVLLALRSPASEYFAKRPA